MATNTCHAHACRHCNPATVSEHNLHISLQNLPRVLPASYRPPSNAHLNTAHPSQFTQYLANHMPRAVTIPMPFSTTMLSTPSYCIVSCQPTVHCCSCSVTRRLSPVFLQTTAFINIKLKGYSSYILSSSLSNVCRFVFMFLETTDCENEMAK
jgi:hypothetical protein